MPEGRQRHRYEPKPLPWYRSPWVSALVVIGFIAVLTVVVVVPVWAIDTPTY